MIVDTSALMAIVLHEPERESFLAAIVGRTVARVAAPTLAELTATVRNRASPSIEDRTDLLVRQLGLVVEPFTPAQAEIAREAYRRYGRGSGHPARLNLGDCFSYALARDLDEPLLFKGDDFTHTDVRSAV